MGPINFLLGWPCTSDLLLNTSGVAGIIIVCTTTPGFSLKIVFQVKFHEPDLRLNWTNYWNSLFALEVEYEYAHCMKSMSSSRTGMSYLVPISKILQATMQTYLCQNIIWDPMVPPAYFQGHSFSLSFRYDILRNFWLDKLHIPSLTWQHFTLHF
jgi:hypothetical protein